MLHVLNASHVSTTRAVFYVLSCGKSFLAHGKVRKILVRGFVKYKSKIMVLGGCTQYALCGFEFCSQAILSLSFHRLEYFYGIT